VSSTSVTADTGSSSLGVMPMHTTFYMGAQTSTQEDKKRKLSTIFGMLEPGYS